jgi:regulator of protease activity HflC (stomatin/prohibitin superfamily)
MWTSLTIALIVIGFFVLKTVRVVPMREAYVKERFGRFVGVMRPGLHFLIPFVDRVAYKQEMREQVLDIPAQSCITKDNIQVEVDGIIYLKVMDAAKASYGIENYRLASINLAQTTMRAEVGKLTLDQTFSERESLNERIVQEIDKASDPWGVKVLRYEIRNVTPSYHVIETLEKQMEAERMKRAEITRATAQKEALSAISEGQRQEAINLSEGERQRRINEAEGRAQEIMIVADAAAQGIRRVGEAIRKPGGSAALQMRLIERFIEQLGKVMREADVTVVPAELANIKGFFEGLSRVGTSLGDAPSGGSGTPGVLQGGATSPGATAGAAARVPPAAFPRSFRQDG